jgi:hypothetical protein
MDELWGQNEFGSVPLDGFDQFAPDECVHGDHSPSSESPGVIYVKPGLQPWPQLVESLRERDIEPSQMRYIIWPWDVELIRVGVNALALFRHKSPPGLLAVRLFPVSPTQGVVEVLEQSESRARAVSSMPEVLVISGYLDLPRLTAHDRPADVRVDRVPSTSRSPSGILRFATPDMPQSGDRTYR